MYLSNRHLLHIFSGFAMKGKNSFPPPNAKEMVNPLSKHEEPDIHSFSWTELKLEKPNISGRVYPKFTEKMVQSQSITVLDKVLAVLNGVPQDFMVCTIDPIRLKESDGKDTSFTNTVFESAFKRKAMKIYHFFPSVKEDIDTYPFNDKLDMDSYLRYIKNLISDSKTYGNYYSLKLLAPGSNPEEIQLRSNIPIPTTYIKPVLCTPYAFHYAGFFSSTKPDRGVYEGLLDLDGSGITVRYKPGKYIASFERDICRTIYNIPERRCLFRVKEKELISILFPMYFAKSFLKTLRKSMDNLDELLWENVSYDFGEDKEKFYTAVYGNSLYASKDSYISLAIPFVLRGARFILNLYDFWNLPTEKLPLNHLPNKMECQDALTCLNFLKNNLEPINKQTLDIINSFNSYVLRAVKLMTEHWVVFLACSYNEAPLSVQLEITLPKLVSDNLIDTSSTKSSLSYLGLECTSLNKSHFEDCAISEELKDKVLDIIDKYSIKGERINKVSFDTLTKIYSEELFGFHNEIISLCIKEIVSDLGIQILATMDVAVVLKLLTYRDRVFEVVGDNYYLFVTIFFAKLGIILLGGCD